MEKNKAIQLLERLQDPEPYEPKLTKDAYDAIQMAIDALSADGDTISRQAAIDALTKDKKALKHIINEMSGYEKEFERLLYQRNQVDYDIDAFKQLPPAQPERRCVNCGRTVNNGGWYEDGRTRCPIEEHYALPKDGYCHLWEKRKDWEDDYVKRAEEGEK